LEPSSLERRNKAIIGVLMVAILAFMLLFLQQQFDRGDYRRAIELLASKQQGQARSIAEELADRSNGQAPDCRPKLISSFRGTLKVTCSTGEGESYRFDVDLVRHTVLPANPAARALVDKLGNANRPGSGQH
jgi:hypothetical protein